jgi:predicted phosphodiesterase
MRLPEVTHQDNVTTLRFTTPTCKWEQWLLLRSDAHQDNVHCRRDIEERHLREAERRNALILDFGDLFCAMNGKYDKRSDKSSLRPEHSTGDYLDALVRTAADRYQPHAKRWVLMARGNHETKIKERHETDLTERLVSTLRDRTGCQTVAGGYTGWVRIMIDRQRHCDRRVLWYTHGYGGGGQVTADMIQSQRQAAYIANADFIVSGHTHDAWHRRMVRLDLNAAGNVEQRSMHLIKIPTYKDEYGTGKGGWMVERGINPKPLGAVWLRMFLSDGGRALREEITLAD